MQHITVEADVLESRLDRYLRRQHFYFPQSLFEKWSRQKRLLLNGEKAKASSRVKAGDTITFPKDAIPLPPPITEASLILSAEEAKKLVDAMRIFENDEILVLDKPSGLATQGGTGQKTSVDDLLKSYSPDARLRLTHRIDRETSGLLIIAKTLVSATKFTNAFRDRIAEKTYVALCQGVFSEKKGMIDTPISRAAHDLEAMTTKERGRDKSREAITHYAVIKEDQGETWVELSPQTGRTHQLRVHLSSIGHPVLGDKKYDGPKASRLMLHAWKISLCGYHFEAPLPQDFRL